MTHFKNGLLTFCWGRLCSLGAHGDRGRLGKVRACPPDADLHGASTFINVIFSIPKVQGRLWGDMKGQVRTLRPPRTLVSSGPAGAWAFLTITRLDRSTGWRGNRQNTQKATSRSLMPWWLRFQEVQWEKITILFIFLLQERSVVQRSFPVGGNWSTSCNSGKPAIIWEEMVGN